MSASATSVAEPEALTEVPENLKRLVRYIVRGFYSIEHALVIDLLIHHPCIKEDDILELLLFERKQLRSLINTLRLDKFIKVRMKMETDKEGKTTRHNYYFINYSTFVNVVKYKMDHMRRKIETEERDSTHRASFQCPNCSKCYTDLEVGRLMDFRTGLLMCEFCGAEVKEEETSAPRRDSRSLMETFNIQMSPVDRLLKELEDVRLAQELLEPEPTDIKSLRPREGSNRQPGERTTWSGDASKNKGFGATENQVTISMEGEESQTVAKAAAKPKETPIWMKKSTVEGASSEAFIQDSILQPGPSSLPSQVTQDNDEVMRTLLAHEKSSVAPPLGGPVGGAREDTSSSESEDDFQAPKPGMSTTSADVEDMESEEEEETVPMVTIGDLQVPFNEVTDELTNRMTPAEKEAYIKLGQEMYQDMYD